MPERIETEAFGNPANQAIFMVSGWAMPKEVMRSFAMRLSQRFHVVVANLPGISLNEEWISRTRIGPNYDIDALSEQLIEAAPKDAWWLGWSLGGMVSVYVAARRSSQVKGLITLATSPSFVARQDWPFGMSVEVFDAFAVSIQRSPAEGLKRFTMLQAQNSGNERDLAKQLQSYLPTHTLLPAALIGGLRLLKSLDVRREWSLLDCPNLHLFGGKDALVSSHALVQQEGMNPFQQCVELSQCTHALFLEEEEECVRYIENYIDANTP
ncbi:alpha/beta fold hydrolase [Marinomonas sp. A79]|uniref:Alpha/beta fold hydrolase n=1 Tax=Marinomonas vulgaris TaxID=2823372 RepID=A0ABS5HCE1_9GAMM|nr:alpha/beta fold hydrolase [Marinomonas vulgaris]MBR7888704.1 alpha/beta fold hydrolase [Marinomonas vulgaris]